MLPVVYHLRDLVERNGTKRLVRAIRATRRDGTVFRWTDHDAPLEVRTTNATLALETFSPTEAPTSDAARTAANFDASSSALVGFFDAAAVNTEDLRIGLWNGVKVEVFVTDWRYPFAGWIEKRPYWISEIQWSGNYVQIELAGLTKQLDVKLGRIQMRDCDATLGDDRCGVNLTGFTSGTRTVSAVATLATPGAIAHPRTTFESNNTVAADDAWKQGHLSWLSGPNAITGLNDHIIKGSKQAAGFVELWLPTPYDIAIGHTFVAIRGCQKRLIEDCFGVFSNAVNHRGFPYMVNPDRILKTPAAKT